ncbi:DUF1433 domain-containing protein [Bacillus cereus]|nr:DUF1433 domain-containing protein [Bacillus cereus]PFN64903.1 DUF1433 domain-containing protein [Bacillus cereus]
MGIKRRSVFCLIFIVIITILEGCNMNDDKKQEEQKIVKKVEEVTIKYFKEEEKVDVTITKHKFAPKDLQSIFISGYVTDDKSKEFSVAVEYANNYHIGIVSTTKNFKLKQ